MNTYQFIMNINKKKYSDIIHYFIYIYIIPRYSRYSIIFGIPWLNLNLLKHDIDACYYGLLNVKSLI